MIKLSKIQRRDVLEPMEHQRKVFLKSREAYYYALWWEMGIGKSKTLIDTFAWLYCCGEIDGVIIISDKGSYLNWPITEIPKHLQPEIPVRISTYSSAKRVPDLVGKDDVLDILIMNVEAFSGERACEHAERFIQTHYTMLVVDEASSIKNVKASRTKHLIRLARMCDYRRILTGTPITLSPLDLYAQCEFLQPGILGHRTFVGFRSEYAEMRTMCFGSRTFQQICGYRHLDRLTEKIQPFSSRILKEDCLDLPDKVYETVYVEHTPEQAKLYTDLKTYAMSQFEQGLLTSTSAITTINKLHQINCGHVKIDDGTTIDIPNNRISALMELLDKIPGKALIWCAFQRDVELILQALHERKDGFGCHYYGRSTAEDRERALALFASEPKCRWFVGTAATGGKGLTLTQASHTIYYSNSDSAEDRWQSEDRNHRIGQTNKVTYFDLVTPGTVDVKKLEQLKRKEDLAFQVLDKFREMLVG
jgi:SNF2 family DNA or RNA helicase